MKLFVAAVFALLASASADVSHLSNTYLPPAQQSYTGSNYQQSFHASGNAGFSAPANDYLPPVQQTYATPAHSFSGGHVDQTYATPVQSYAGPAAQSYSSSVSYSGPSVQHTYSAPSSEYLPPGQQSYSGPASVHQTFSAPAVSYSSGAVHSYSAPSVHSYSGPSSYSSSVIDAGTQYASNGGYVYRKK